MLETIPLLKSSSDCTAGQTIVKNVAQSSVPPVLSRGGGTVSCQADPESDGFRVDHLRKQFILQTKQLQLIIRNALHARPTSCATTA